MSVVAQATVPDPFPVQGASIPIVIRNNEASAQSHIQAAATVRDSTGTIVGTGSSQGFHPERLEPGQVAIGFIYLAPDSKIPSGSTMAVTVSSDSSTSPNGYFADLKIVELNNTGTQIVGSATNPRDREITGPIKVDALCIDDSGNLLADAGTFTTQDNAPSGGTVSFTISLYGKPCPGYLVGASGYDMTAIGQ